MISYFSKVFLVLISLGFVNTAFATSSTLAVLKKKPKAKKIKIQLKNGEKYKGYIIKVDDDFVYSVPRKKMVQDALDNNCESCAKVPLESIAKVYKKSKFLLILGGVLLLIGIGVGVFVFSSDGPGDRGFLLFYLLLLTIASLPILFGIGWGVGSIFKKKYKAAEAKKYLHEHSAVYYANK